MPIFFFIAISYISANIYFLYKVTTVFHLGTVAAVLMGTFVFIMTLMPVLVPVCSHKASELFMRTISYTGYLWLAFLVLFFPAGVILDLYNIVIQNMARDLAPYMLAPERTFYIPLFLSGAIIAYGYFEAKNLRVERLVINTSKLPEDTGRVRIAQISDLHLSVTVGDAIVDKVIKMIEKEKPDIIVSTGDLVDGVVRHVNHLPAKLNNLKARYGKFAVIGNHEFYGGLRHTVKFIEESGFTVLRDNGVTIENIINIAGMDFTGGETKGFSTEALRRDEREVLSSLQPGLFTLLLKHRSDVREECLGLFDLQLSGHSHKGQIFPVSLATMFLFQYHTGFTKLPKGSAIHTSRGTGTAGPPVRFLSAPEITIIDVVSE